MIICIIKAQIITFNRLSTSGLKIQLDDELDDDQKTNLEREWSWNGIVFVGSWLQRDDLPLTRIHQQLLHTDDAESQEEFAAPRAPVVQLEQDLLRPGTQITWSSLRKKKQNKKLNYCFDCQHWMFIV